MQSLEAGAPTTAYNLGNGRGFSVKEVIDTASQVIGRDIPLRIGARRAGDPPSLVGDATRIRKELGWQPQYAALEDMVATAWKWHGKMNGGR